MTHNSSQSSDDPTVGTTIGAYNKATVYLISAVHPHYGFDALEVYIQTQKALFARTGSDVDCLRLLREQAAADPEFFVDAFDDKLNDNVFNFDHQPDIAAEVQDKIDWDLLKGQDPTPLCTFAADLRTAHYVRSQPSSTQSSALSSAKQLQLAPNPIREKDQLRRIRLLHEGGLTLRASGVHIHRDIGDETADVDIATTDDALISLPLAEPAQSKIHSTRPTRSRRPAPTRTPATKAKRCSEPDKCAPPMLPPAIKKEKPKSETQKQAWSVSEQHLDERLLSEIPDGEKNRYEAHVLSLRKVYVFFLHRWSKISKAGHGWPTYYASGRESRTKAF
ncbi:hypothetical protein V8E53_002987 [Lactarius tabidus]